MGVISKLRVSGSHSATDPYLFYYDTKGEGIGTAG